VSCPGCGAPANVKREMSRAGRAPQAGSACLCWHCLAVSVYVSATELRRPTPAELDQIMADPGVNRAIAIVTASRDPSEAVLRTRAAARADRPEP
jgi:hypothetical protein